ncbi:MAG: DUF4388 domain-containing protein [Chloroflexota bacterium]|nr:DUF4388 domain-containing protein [Chloroflexota bacterium]
MSLQGELSDMSFEDLFQVLTENNKQGLLLLESGNYRGRLFIWNGEPYSAAVAKFVGSVEQAWLNGEDAVHHMSNWQEGSFQFRHEVVPSATRNIFINKRELMLANIFKQDTFAPTAPIYTTTARHAPPEPISLRTDGSVRPAAGYHAKIRQLELTVTEWAVLIQLTGLTKVQEIAHEAQLSLTVVMQVLEKMVQLGLVEIDATVATAYRSDRHLAGTGPLSPRANPLSRSALADARQALSGNSGGSNNYRPPSPAFAQTSPYAGSSGSGYNPAPPRPANNPHQPKRGLLASLMAKIRGL